MVDETAFEEMEYQDEADAIGYLKAMTTTKKCKGCGVDISHKHSNARFCGGRCKDKYWNKINPMGYGLRSESDFDSDPSCNFHG